MHYLPRRLSVELIEHKDLRQRVLGSIQWNASSTIVDQVNGHLDKWKIKRFDGVVFDEYRKTYL